MFFGRAKAKKPSLLMKAFVLKWLSVIAFGILTACQMLWKLPAINNPDLYYWGLAVCLLLLAINDRRTTPHQDVKIFLTFFLWTAVYNLVREFLRPTELDMHEIYGLPFALFFTFRDYRKWKKSKN